MNPLHLFHITNDRIMQDITNGRCGWCGTDELYVKYHDQEWGKLVTDDKTLFEFLVLESAQAGLSWAQFENLGELVKNTIFVA